MLLMSQMSKWVNKYTCPGFMYVPHKPWKFGNEYHDASCADSDFAKLPKIDTPTSMKIHCPTTYTQQIYVREGAS